MKRRLSARQLDISDGDESSASRNYPLAASSAATTDSEFEGNQSNIQIPSPTTSTRVNMHNDIFLFLIVIQPSHGKILLQEAL